MSQIEVLPDIEAAAIEYLLGVTDVSDFVADRVYASSPQGVIFPYLTVEIVSGRSVAHNWLGADVLQLFGWAHRDVVGARGEARDIAAVSLTALLDARNVAVGDCLIGSCDVISSPRPLYDQPTSNPRFLAEVLVHYHALLAS